MRFQRTLAAVVFAAFMLAGTVALAADKKEIRWASSRVGSSGHRAITNLTEVIGPSLPQYSFTVMPTPGAIVTVKGYATEQFEGYYGSDVGFYELKYDINRFKNFKEKMKRQPVQSFWTFTIEMGVGIHARDKGNIKSWGDLSGKVVFTGPRPWDTRAQLERAFEALGVKHEYIEVSTSTAGSLLEGGRFVAFGVYTNAEATTAPWITEASFQTDWAALSPSASEIDTLKAKGFNPVSIPTKAFGKKSTHVDQVTMVPFFYGLHLGLEISEDEMYRILKVIESKKDELAKADKTFKQIAADMPLMQRRGVESSYNLVPIHPGLAKYMREKGVWDKKWDQYVAK